MKNQKSLLSAASCFLVSALGGVALLPSACVPKQERGSYVPPQQNAQTSGAANQEGQPPPPPLPPAAPTPPSTATGNVYTDRFLELWTDLHNMQNGYFSPEGIPYHSVETLIVEAPDYGHTTTSEAYSYWIWLEAMYGKVTKDWSHLDRAWKNMEYYIIPTPADQPTNHAYGSTKPATYADEADLPEQFPVPLVGDVKVGVDPLADELKSTYGSPNVYAMHWLLDVDNWYGFGNRGDGSSHASYINTFQRGPQESVWETIPHSSWEQFNWGGKNGFLDLFTTQPNYGRQWRYTNAPDADARSVQAIYWAKKWSDEAGGSSVVAELTQKAAKMGDYVRYCFFDKYFKKMGCNAKSCEPGTGRDSAHYLISWYFGWGGSIPPGPAWAWRIGSSHNHQGYQNTMAAYALANEPSMRPRSANGASDWATSLGRQLEFYRWLQSAEGGFAGGATNSWKGRYEQWPAGTPTFYGMPYDANPVFQDPPSNDWFGFQVWSVQRVAEYYYVTGDAKAKLLMDRWAAWAMKNTKLLPNGGYEVPIVMKWTGQPSGDWNEQTQNFDPNDKTFNSGLHVQVTVRGDDVGTTAGLVHTLIFYSAKAKDEKARKLCKELLDRMWAKHRDEIGLTNTELRKDFLRFNDKVFVPAGWQGKTPNGDIIDSNATFIGIRSQYKKDPSWPQVEQAMKTGTPPKLRFHRFWAQAHVALAYATYGWLYPDKS